MLVPFTIARAEWDEAAREGREVVRRSSGIQGQRVGEGGFRFSRIMRCVRLARDWYDLCRMIGFRQLFAFCSPPPTYLL